MIRDPATSPRDFLSAEEAIYRVGFGLFWAWLLLPMSHH